MQLQDIFFGVFVLILLYLILINWVAANTILTTGAKSSIGLIQTLQGRAVKA
jgi:hypothetical protein